MSIFGLSSLGSSLSVLDFVNVGSALSLRAFCKFGSSMSVYGLQRLGSSLSVLDFVHLGSALSLRSFCKLGSTLSVFGLTRLGSSLSVLDFVSIGSAMSLRNFFRMGASMSVYGLARLGSTMSVLDFIHLGSSLSVRSFCRFGSELQASTYKFTHPDAPLTQSAMMTVHANAADSGIKMESQAGFQVLSTSTTGGTLHGLWLSDEVISSSSAEIKEGIENLEDYTDNECTTPLCRADQRQRLHRDRWLRSVSGKQNTGASRPVRSVGPLLKELRPVAYRYKGSKQPSHVRFGFVADELEELVPEVVRKVGEQGGKTQKGVVYQDLIALLTAALREHQGRLEAVESSGFSEKPRESQVKLEEAVKLLRQELKAVTSSVATMQQQMQLQEMRQGLLIQEIDKIKQQCDCARSF